MNLFKLVPKSGLAAVDTGSARPSHRGVEAVRDGDGIGRGPHARASPDGAGPRRLTGRHDAALRQLAHALNVPVETFLDEPRAGESGELLALLRHWLAIEDNQGRRRVLSVARQEAERAGYSECA